MGIRRAIQGPTAVVRPLLLLAITLIAPLVSAWNPDMPGGMKIVINGETYSFSTDTCSGGVFFKKPVHAQLTCVHGYFLRRQNGCKMAGSDILGGQNFVCQSVNNNKNNLVQAFIPLTNPDRPLDHTVSFYDDEDTLKHFRRYSYVDGLEEKYAGMHSEPRGAIVANMKRTKRAGFGSFCYKGESGKEGSSYLVPLSRSAQIGEASKPFSTCNVNSVDLPWNEGKQFPFTKGFSAESVFLNEIEANIPSAIYTHNDITDASKFEIWGGMAYCLQAKVRKTYAGKIKMTGIRPSINSLQLFCSPDAGVSPNTLPVLQSRPKREALKRVKRLSKDKTEELTGCISNCFGPGEEDCRRSLIGHAGPWQVCPPYCGGRPTVG